MRVIVKVVVAVLVVAPAVSSSNVAIAQSRRASTSDDQRLRQLTVEWMSAVATKDARRLEQIMAPEYTLEMPGAPERVGKSEWVKNAIGKQWRNFRYENVSVRIDGAQAIVTSKLYFKVSPIPVTLDSGIVDVWVKRNNDWQVRTRYLAASEFFTKVTFAAGAVATLVLLGAATLVLRLSRRLRPKAA